MDENRDGLPEEAQDRQDHRAEAPCRTWSCRSYSGRRMPRRRPGSR
ncbi:MAG: hypothetical protein ACLUNQ_00430 [Oscillospiraceae bacterium]